VKTFSARYPYPPDQVWAALPAAIAAANKGKMGAPDPQPWTWRYATGMTLRTWGVRVVVTVRAEPQGTLVEVATSLKFGLIDWGERRGVATRLFESLGRHLSAGRPRY
jgi:hypothetical protein